ncbi:hypothetical protein BJ912DRAFT_859949 [Pholiota molesta]|nr:hypothetical protein BJ912DRAFT_859949 [Pholiota molesta]
MPSYHTRHVRFANRNTFHSTPVTPAMPPWTFLSSTDSSTLGAITPPWAFKYPVPLHSPSKSRHAGLLRPHPYLEMYGIKWDMMDHPYAMSRNHHPISARAWKEPATSPPLPFLSITVANFPWRFSVYASNHSYVTFQDVVETIYRSLRKNITEGEFRMAGASATDRRRATRAYEHRYRRQLSTRLYEEEKRGGMKRVDFLMERTRFAGLSNISRRPDEWHLNIT